MKTNYQTGHDAEKKAACYLESKGYTILELNWKTSVCEIDIIAKKSNRLYFIEVKYRRSISQGDGFEYITKAKLKKMYFAANVWHSENNWSDEIALAVISMSDSRIDFIEV